MVIIDNSTNDAREGFASVMADDDITLKAKGLFAFLFSREGEHMTLDRVLDSTAESVSAVRGAIKELEAAGYLTRTRRDDGSRFAVYDWVLRL